jgi:hypothetical protein
VSQGCLEDIRVRLGFIGVIGGSFTFDQMVDSSNFLVGFEFNRFRGGGQDDLFAVLFNLLDNSRTLAKLCTGGKYSFLNN